MIPDINLRPLRMEDAGDPCSPTGDLRAASDPPCFQYAINVRFLPILAMLLMVTTVGCTLLPGRERREALNRVPLISPREASSLRTIDYELYCGEEVVYHHVRATGGRESLNRLGGIELSGTLTNLTDGSRGSVQMLHQGNRFLVSKRVPGVGNTVVGSNGTEVWSRTRADGGSGQRFSGGEAIGVWTDTVLSVELFWQEHFSNVTFLGQHVFEGRPSYVLKFIPRQGDWSYLRYYDVRTGLLFAAQKGECDMDADLLENYRFADYRPVDGFLIPHLIIMEQGEHHHVIRIRDVNTGLRFPPDTFELRMQQLEVQQLSQ